MSPPKAEVARWVTCPACRRRTAVRRRDQCLFIHPDWTNSHNARLPGQRFDCPGSGQPAPAEVTT
jgi:hypothetical protein